MRLPPQLFLRSPDWIPGTPPALIKSRVIVVVRRRRNNNVIKERSRMSSFIESPFSTRVEYEAWQALPASEKPAALEAAKQKEAPCTVAALADAAASLKVVEYGPMEYPPARIATIKGQFDEEAKGGPRAGRLPLKRVHRLLFNDEERKEYDFDTWDTDLQATVTGCGKDMSWEDVLKFLEENL